MSMPIASIRVERAAGRPFDYRIPEGLRPVLRVGMRVRVPLGKAEVQGVVVGFSEHSRFEKLKPILALVDDKVAIDGKLMQLAEWMAAYYAAPVETALKTVLPGSVRRMKAAFKARLFVTPAAQAGDVAALETLRKRAPKQAAAIDVLTARGAMFMQHLAQEAGVGTSVVRELGKKGWVHIDRHTCARDPFADQEILRTQPLPLMPQQQEALQAVKASIETLQPPTILLFGVTGSGKTEVYLQAIAHARARGKGAIVLVPEISLTPQMIERFRGRFGEEIAILHSHLGDGERHDEWHRIRDGRAPIAIGARSALFAPVRELGLIVVDEEHEPSYKQDQAPRYHARDVAVMRGHIEGCAVLLGTATPSLETYYNAQRGKYGLAVMPHRVDHRTMPAVRVVDMRQEAEKAGQAYVFSADLVEAIRQRLDAGEQTMLFLNRRGYSTSMICPKCGYVLTCDHCSVPMTYHRDREQMICHLCGAVRAAPRVCPQPTCGDRAIRFSGLGTQRIEALTAKLFPRARVARMDLDTTRGKDAHRHILGDFRAGKIDILVGTQMIAKGLHFPNITLVGVVSADTALHMPDFRAGERTFQLLTQVAGRAGRGEITGEVIIQTFTPFHPAIQAARRLDFPAFYDQEIEFRKELAYPPFTRLVRIDFAGRVEEAVAGAAQATASALLERLPKGSVLSDPAPAPIARARDEFRYQLLFRGPSARKLVAAWREAEAVVQCPPSIRRVVDVDALVVR